VPLVRTDDVALQFAEKLLIAELNLSRDQLFKSGTCSCFAFEQAR
jgi:hypothetical protein